MRRPIPPVAPSDLRDHADPARVDQLWTRIEAALPPPALTIQGAWSLPVLPAIAGLAVAAAFIAGIALGRGTFRDRLVLPEPPRATSPLHPVLAAGSRAGSASLPGGGEIDLSPDTIVEPAPSPPGGLDLRLLRGAVTLMLAAEATAGARSAPVTVVAGGAAVRAQHGRLRVSRDGAVVDVSVLEGSADLAAPGAELRTLRRGERVVVHLDAESVAEPVAVGHRAARAEADASADPPPEGPGAPAIAEWRARMQARDYARAFELLEERGIDHVIGQAAPDELMAISDVARKVKRSQHAVAALERLLDRFPDDAYAYAAAYNLNKIYTDLGDLDRAKMYFDRMQTLSPVGPLNDDALARQIEAAYRAGNQQQVVKLARRYATEFPDGRHKDMVERWAAPPEPGSDEATYADEVAAPLEEPER